MSGLSRRAFRSRRGLLLENLALRQQLFVLKRRKRRPKLAAVDKLFWVAVRKLWSSWKGSLILVSPETVVRRHRAGFRLYWAWISRHRIRTGRRRISKELRGRIFRMVAENPTWVRPGFMASSWRLALTFRNERFRAGSNEHPKILSKEIHGRPFSGTIASHCCDGLLHNPYAHLWCPVLLLSHRAGSAADSALQRHLRSDLV